MSDAFTLMLGLQSVVRAVRDHNAAPVVPEPEFRPFLLSSRRGAGPAAAAPSRADEVSPANTTRAPRTLEEMGVPRSMAAEIEAVLRVMGKVEGDRIVGFTYRTPDGVLHPLRAATPVATGASDRAA